MIRDQLKTRRMVLRRVKAADAAQLHSVFSNARAMRYWSCPAFVTISQTHDLLAAMLRSNRDESDEFVLELAGQVIGKAGAWRLPEVGFILHPDHWGTGLAREAMEAIIPHLFAHHDFAALIADADPRNEASIGMLLTLGFHETHRAEKTMQWGTEWCDSVYFRLPRGTP